jgi:hypothetical protein
MAAEEAFAAWTRDGVIWSDWAKPVAFVTPALGAAPPSAPAPAVALPLTLDPSAVVIVDLPGPESVAAGVSLAERGWCPVPLFNGTAGPSAVIDVDAISRALIASAGHLRTVAIPPGAAPAFLLDSRRLEQAGLKPGKYDNRWVALPQDFPSGALLASRGFRTAILVRRDGLSVPADLAHVLVRWAEHGIGIRVFDAGTGQAADNVTVPRPSRFKLAWYAVIALMGLRRSNVGGFGATIPEQTASSGGYG